MQTPALFKPMNLGEGFGFFESDFDLGYSTDGVFDTPISADDFLYVRSPFDTPVFEDVVNTTPVVEGDIASDFPLDLPENVAVVDNSGNVNDQSGKQIISATAITNIAKNNPGREGEAIAKTLASTAPEYTKQFKSYDELVKAGYNLFNTTKAVIQGKPIPQSIRSPYVYNPNDPNMVRRTTTATSTSTGFSSTNMLLIGGVALAAFLVLRKK